MEYVDDDLEADAESDNCHGVQAQHHNQQQTLTQDRRKLLKRTRSLAVISEDESRSIHHHRNTFNLGSPFDTSSLQHRRPQLIPRAKLIDRNSLKDRLCKSQQHLSDSYDRFNEISVRPSPSRSISGLCSLPAPLDSLPDPVPYPRGGPTWNPIVHPSEKLNILKWPKSPRRYRSVQDLNSVGGFVDIIEDNFWPGEENRSVECIYTQVKRKRKEHRSLDSILFEDDSDELEYFDILNLLPLSNVRLEIDESNSKSDGVILEPTSKDSLSQELKSHPTVLSVLTKKDNVGNEKYSTYSGGISITEIEDSSPAKIDSVEKNTRIQKNSDILEKPSKASAIEKSITSFHKIAREKNQLENISCTKNCTLDLINKQENKQSKSINKLCHFKIKQNKLLAKENKPSHKNNKSVNSELQNKNIYDKSKTKEINQNKSHCLTDIKEIEDMSRRPQVLKIVDSDVTKPKHFLKLGTLDVKSVDGNITETMCENMLDCQQTLKGVNKLDLINEDNHETNIMDNTNNNSHTTRLTVDDARSFFEKKNTDKDLLTNQHAQGTLEKSIKETSNIFNKSSNVGKGSLGFEATSESSDLGLGSEIGSDIRRLSIDENINSINEKFMNDKKSNDCMDDASNFNNKNEKNHSNLTRSRSCIDSMQSEVFEEPEFDRVRYKIVKPNVLSQNIINNSKNNITYDGLIQYLREYSLQDLLMDNNVVIIEPVRAEIERKSSFHEKNKSTYHFKSTQNLTEKINDKEIDKFGKASNGELKNEFIKVPRQSSLRKHFFYQPIRVNRELNDDELPDPDTVRNVKKMFEETMKRKLKINNEITNDCSIINSSSMKDLRTIESGACETPPESTAEVPRSRCSSRAKDLRKMFESLDKSSPSSTTETKDITNNIKNESKTRTIVQSFETRSGHTSPSNSNSSKNKINKYHQRHLHNWDTGSVSSGVSSDYPDTDVGSALPCTSSEDEELYCQEDDGVDERYEGHYVSQDVLKKIREYGTSVTYYGGKVVNTYNGPLISPMVNKNSKLPKKNIDYIKFRLVKSNSCDSRLELTGRIEDNQIKYRLNGNQDKGIDLRQFTINEMPSIEITSMDHSDADKINDIAEPKEEKHEPPVVISLEPKKEESKSFKADFKLGKLDDCATVNRFTTSALTRWQINENIWKRTVDFGKMEFEEYEILEDSLNGVNI